MVKFESPTMNDIGVGIGYEVSFTDIYSKVSNVPLDAVHFDISEDKKQARCECISFQTTHPNASMSVEKCINVDENEKLVNVLEPFTIEFLDNVIKNTKIPEHIKPKDYNDNIYNYNIVKIFNNITVGATKGEFVELSNDEDGKILALPANYKLTAFILYEIQFRRNQE